MGSKLEYWVLLTKIAVVVLDVMIEDGIFVGVPVLQRLVVDVLWHVVGGIVLLPNLPSQTRQFSKVQFPIGFGFSNSPKVPPNCPKLVQLPIFYLVNYYGGNCKIQKSPNYPKFSRFTQNSPNFQVQFPNAKNYPT
jgi:hypothetical protein